MVVDAELGVPERGVSPDDVCVVGGVVENARCADAGEINDADAAGPREVAVDVVEYFEDEGVLGGVD